jgi:hypothetical protein
MNIIQPLISNPQPPIIVEPTSRALNYPAVTAQSLTAIYTFASYPHFYTSLADCSTTSWIIIPFVTVQLLRPLARTPFGSLNRFNCINHPSKHLRVVNVSRSLSYCYRDALSVDHNMALRARFAAIRRIRPGRRAPFGAGTENESIQARLQSILSESPSLSNNCWWSLRHTPDLFQSLSLRQQVTPEPQPISGGSIAQGMPLRRTKIIPRKASRLETGGRPPFGLGRSSGSKGWMTFHNSSETNGFDIAVDSIKHQFARF